ncbi:Sensor histidine kinase [gamma proteobacterium IMCC1989]|nr:Sensor histidine kinase [gamma proteobacterium IMCC1989]
MNLKQKIQLLAVLPLAIAMLLVVLVTQYQFDKLSLETATAYRDGVIERRQAELKNYTLLALSSIDHLYNNQDIDTEVAQELAKDVLTNLIYKEDGYFFAYTVDGVGVVHPIQPFRIGENWWELQDESGLFLIQELISNAQAGGDYLQYSWDKPSVGEVGTKMAYSVMLDKWEWMLGTGVYIDDVEDQVSRIQLSIDHKIISASYVILAIGIISVIAVFSTGLLLQFSERKLADGKLQELTKRILTAQEEERRRVSRELHDGISQLIASAKFSIETALLKIKSNQSPEEDLMLTTEKITQTLTDLRRISRDLHPRILDDHGLSAGIESLSANFSRRTGISINLDKVAVKNMLSLEIKTTFYRVAQEALTNIERHSSATEVNIAIGLRGRWLVLSIRDNGNGFDVASLNRNKSPMVGIGLRNMHERLSYHKGMFTIESNRSGTTIEARIPKDYLKFN